VVRKTTLSLGWFIWQCIITDWFVQNIQVNINEIYDVAITKIMTFHSKKHRPVGLKKNIP
jgi:hypothetical protein